MSVPAPADLRDSLKRAREAFALAVPATPREHVQHVLVLSLWLDTWAEELGPAALEDLANRLRPLRKGHHR